MNEHLYTIMIAVIDLAPLASLTPEQRTSYGVGQAIVHGSIDNDLYDALCAVASSAFASLVVHATGPNGRARTEPLRQASRAQCAANTLRVPRSVVADIASRAISVTMRSRLAFLQTSRLKAGAARVYPVMRGTDRNGCSMVLLKFDVHGYVWLTETELLRFPGAQNVVDAFAALHLDDFGGFALLHGRTVGDKQTELPPVVLLTTRWGGVCTALAHSPNAARTARTGIEAFQGSARTGRAAEGSTFICR